MTKKIILVICLSVVVCFFFLQRRNNCLPEITFENIEALGSGESGTSWCVSGGSAKCDGQSGYFSYQ